MLFKRNNINKNELIKYIEYRVAECKSQIKEIEDKKVEDIGNITSREKLISLHAIILMLEGYIIKDIKNNDLETREV